MQPYRLACDVETGAWRTVLSWFGLLVAAAVVVVVGIYVVFWPLSDLIARHDVGAITGPHRAAALQAARDAARGRLLTFGAGLFAAGALIYTARNFSLSRQGQVTDRYTKTIEQLGSDKLDVRIGGVYALERIARDSPRDHPTIMEVLAAFIREHGREQWPPAKDSVEPPPWKTRPDVQAAATVIGRRTVRFDSQPINLDAANLTSANLTDAILSSADLTDAWLMYANLTDAVLDSTNLTGAIFIRAKLAGAYLSEVNLSRARLSRARLPGSALNGANLTGAILDWADLTGADLSGAIFHSADLTRANLTGAMLHGADLTAASLDSALWPEDAVVPEGWQRDTGSGRLKRTDTGPAEAGD